AAVRRTLRNHPHRAGMLDQERIRKMPGLLENRPQQPSGAVLVQLDGGDDAFAEAVVEVLDKDEVPALPLDRERIGIEAGAGLGSGSGRDRIAASTIVARRARTASMASARLSAFSMDGNPLAMMEASSTASISTSGARPSSKAAMSGASPQVPSKSGRRVLTP